MMEFAASWGYFGLFVMAFLAATLLPLSSEALLGLLLVDGQFSIGWLVVAASSGNVLGSIVNYGMGRYFQRFSDRKWFPASQTQVERAQRRYERWGLLSLFLSWVPIIGDPLTVVAGFMKVRFWAFVLIVTLAKTGRYCVIALGVSMIWLGHPSIAFHDDLIVTIGF